jgi:hypothetical protein
MTKISFLWNLLLKRIHKTLPYVLLILFLYIQNDMSTGWSIRKLLECLSFLYLILNFIKDSKDKEEESVYRERELDLQERELKCKEKELELEKIKVNLQRQINYIHFARLYNENPQLANQVNSHINSFNTYARLG